MRSLPEQRAGAALHEICHPALCTQIFRGDVADRGASGWAHREACKQGLPVSLVVTLLLLASSSTSPARAQIDAGDEGAVPDGGGDGAVTAVEDADASVPSEQTKRLTESEAEVGELKTKNIMRFGVTLGFAVGVQATIGPSTSNASEALFPYFAVFPAYFGPNEAVRHYCAASWGAGSEHDATLAATAIARKWGERAYLSIATAMRGGWSWDAIEHEYLPDNGTAGIAARGALTLVSRALALKGTERQSAENDAIDALSDLAWNPTVRAKCGWHKFGLWLGKPLAYTSSIKLDVSGHSDDALTEREMTPVVNFGLVMSPNAYFSILVGAGPVLVDVEMPDGSVQTATVWNFYSGVGGNLDVLGVFFK